MKKNVIILALVLIVLGACSPESSDNQSLEIDLSQIVNPETVKAEATFDNSQKGIYKGVFATVDISYHGILTVNMGNDTKYNAVLVVDNEKYGFVEKRKKQNNVYHFEGFLGSFDIRFDNNGEALIENAIINNTSATGKLFKETSQNKVIMSLGTFIDDTDATFSGTWDLVSTGTQTISVPTGQPFPVPPTIDVDVNIIDEIIVMKSGGVTFTDFSMEEFTPGTGCDTTLPNGSQAPFFTGPQTLEFEVFGTTQSIFIDEWAIATQTSLFAGQTANWSLSFSTFQGNIYYDENCNTISAGTWIWAGRTGSIFID